MRLGVYRHRGFQGDRLLMLSMVGILCFLPCLARNKERVKHLGSTGKGSSGLFNLYVPDTLRRGEASLGFSGIHLNREPGALEFTLFPLSLAVGLDDRVEIFTSWEANRRVNARAIKTFKLGSDSPVSPAVLQNSTATAAYFNDAPFLDVGFGSGAGELWTGLKFNVLSESRGSPFGLAWQPVVKLPLSQSRSRLLRGLTNGSIEAGYDFLFSKEVGEGLLVANYGYLFTESSQGIDLQHRLNYGIGYERPLGSPHVRVLLELLGSRFFGGRSGLANPKSPLDFYSGLRFSPAHWISISAAYGANFNQIDPSLPIYQIPSASRNGFFLQVAFHRKVNRPPSVQCNPLDILVREGETVVIRVAIADPDDDLLSLTWTASAGAISRRNTAVVFDSSGLEEGRYVVTAEVGDGRQTSSCSSIIRVEKEERRPEIVCEKRDSSVRQGESVTLRLRVSDPNHDPLTYSWKIGGTVVASDQPELVFGSVGRSPGVHSATVMATDSDGMEASCSFRVTVQAETTDLEIRSLSPLISRNSVK